MKARDRLTPDMERELQALEDALAGGVATAKAPDEHELQELALALRAEAPGPNPAFASAMRARMQAGFPPGPAARRLGTLLGRVSATSVAAGAIAAVLVALVVGVAITGRGGGSDGAGGGGVAQESGSGAGGAGGDVAAGRGEMAPESTLPAPADSAAAPRDRGFAPGREQRIARSAALTLEAPGDELGRLAERVTAVTDRYRGFVLRSSVTSGDEGDAGGTLSLRIPAASLRDAVRAISALASVRSSTQTGEDVTGSFVTARDRLQAARAERIGLLRRLEQADTDTEAEAIRRRLDLVAREINGLRGQLRQLRLRTNYAAVEVTLAERDGDAGAAPGPTEDALDDALGSLLGAANIGLRVLGVALPLGLLALLGWAAARLVRRRRRESVLA